MRCPDCNKFVANDEQEPEVESLEIDADGMVTASVRVVNACAECGTELTEATLEMEEDHRGDVETHECSGGLSKEDRELSVEEISADRDSKTEGRGRGLRTFYGATVDYNINCSCGDQVCTGQASEFIQASSMDPLN